jgi:ABC-2 type transport system ATP-binding protein
MIRVQNVSRRFGSVVALEAVSLQFEPGERVAVVGTNGSGKTTLLRALLGLLRVEGRIEVCGEDVAKAPEVALRALSYMPQVAPPLDAPVAELVRVFCTLRCRTMEQVSARARRLSLDLQAIGRTRVRDLSGGMKQKLLAAMALAAEAPVLVCDEPTANLDAAARAAFFEEVNARPATGILLLCSHRVDEVRHLVDRVIEMKDGRVVQDASLASLLASLRSFRVDVAFRDPRLGDSLSEDLAARGLARVSGGRFSGFFSQMDKVEVVSGVLATWRGQLADLSVLDVDTLAGERVLRSVK